MPGTFRRSKRLAFLEAQMRKKRMTESDERRQLRLEKRVEQRASDAEVEDRAIELMVARSIDLYGA